MNEQQIYDRIRLAMNEAPRNRQTAELHLQKRWSHMFEQLKAYL